MKNREFLFDHTSKDETKYDSTRRSVYLPVIRNHLYDAFQLFDFADASVMNSNRTTTTVAPQALFMMNSDLVTDAASRVCRRGFAISTGSDEQRMRFAYESSTWATAECHGESASNKISGDSFRGRLHGGRLNFTSRSKPGVVSVRPS